MLGDQKVDQNRVDLLSSHILKECNYYHKKNKNNLTSLKSKNGSTSITNGLTISEFKEKYHL